MVFYYVHAPENTMSGDRVVVVMDGARVAPCGNVSESYNAMFASLEAHGVRLLTAPMPLPPLPLWDDVVVVEPGLWNQDMLRWWCSAHRAALQSPAHTLSLFVDDVEGTGAAVDAILHDLLPKDALIRGQVGVFAPYPTIVREALGGAGLGAVPVRFLSHSVAAVFRKTVPPCHRRQQCLLWGNQNPVHYPGRAAVAAAAAAAAGSAGSVDILALKPPVYGASGVPQRRVPPSVIAAHLDACTSCFAGGDKLGVLTAKHLEAAARGVCVITGPTQAHQALDQYGLHFHAARDTEEVVALASRLRPGPWEVANAAIVSMQCTADHVAGYLLQALHAARS